MGRRPEFMISTITAHCQRQADARRIVSRLMTALEGVRFAPTA
jgi:hypothetical protein